VFYSSTSVVKSKVCKKFGVRGTAIAANNDHFLIKIFKYKTSVCVINYKISTRKHPLDS